MNSYEDIEDRTVDNCNYGRDFHFGRFILIYKNHGKQFLARFDHVCAPDAIYSHEICRLQEAGEQK